MDDVINPDESLRAANPVNERDLVDPPNSRFAQALFQRITDAPYRVPAKAARRRSRQVYVAALAAVLTTGAGVGYAVSVRRAPRQLVAGCYAEARLDAAVADAPGAGDPLSACQELWAHGHIPGQPAVAGQALSACVLPGGSAGVFPDPAGTACRRLRLAPIDTPLSVAPATTVSGASRVAPAPFAAMRDTVVTGLSGDCLDADQGRALVEGALDHAGLAAWKVTIAAPFSAERPCASPGFDELNHQVRLIPNPRAAGPGAG